MSFRTSRIVEFHDTDMAGIMHFSAFFLLMESAEHEFVRTLGYGVYSRHADKDISFPRVQASCEYKSPAKCEDVLDIEVNVVRLGRSSVTYEFLFSHDSRDVARGEITCACCQIRPGEPMKAIALPDDLSQKLRAHAP